MRKRGGREEEGGPPLKAEGCSVFEARVSDVNGSVSWTEEVQWPPEACLHLPLRKHHQRSGASILLDVLSRVKGHSDPNDSVPSVFPRWVFI